jgi:selenium metabolism protein YedF
MPEFINALGKECPIPVVMAKQAIAGGKLPFTIEVDNQTSVENLTRLAASQGLAAPVRDLSGGVFALDFSRPGETSAAESAPAAPLPAPGGDYVVFIGRDIVGSGDRTLGTNLIRMFFYTLANSDSLPAALLFMNDGVKLPTLDDQVVEHLQALSARGVEVLVCGACLNFYGLTDSLRAGTVSNMYDIVSRMQSAAKVISM